MKTRGQNTTGAKRVRPVRASGLKLSIFARRLLNAWRNLQLPLQDANIVVAVSGGADSTALLLALHELIVGGHLKAILTVAHLDHGLRQESRADAKWVAKLARQLGYEIAGTRVDVKKRALATGDNLEQAARRARYEFLAKVAGKRKAQLILTAHTIDDQAETVLLRLLRGSGADGLTGIDPVRRFDSRSAFLLARPLVTWARRAETLEHCRQSKVDFRADSMNEDEQFARVRVRKQLIPLMESFNGKIVEALARTSELLRDDLVVLNQKADVLLLEASQAEPANKTETNVPRISVSVLANAPAAVRRRALRKWISQGRGDLRRFELVHIIGVERLLAGNRGGRIAELPGGCAVLRKQRWLELAIKS
jgi:tRNA(Ile)-lysidine synthase